MKKTITLSLLVFTTIIFAQQDVGIKNTLKNAEKYQFTNLVDIDATEVKSQGQTGTCWSFSSLSFIESEIVRIKGEKINISEMFNVRNTYPKKAWNYIMRQGKAQFSEGGLAHDAIKSLATYGLMPESAYTGMPKNSTTHNHSKLIKGLKEVLNAYIKNDKNSKYPNWKVAVDSVLNTHLGTPPATFYYNGVMHTPKSFLKETGIESKNYVTLTSFNHTPFYHYFILNIPDNFSNGSMYNLPIKELEKEVDNALKKGYSLALDCDVSEKTFSAKFGIAILPKNVKDNEKALNYLVTEKEVNQDFRQQEFENFNTTDDHLMHIIGMIKDQKGNEYYKVKNSWGSTSKRIGNNGYIYMSKPYFRLKVISVLVNKKGLSKELQNKL